MPATAIIDGIACTLETLPDGSIRVTHESVAFNACHGAATDGPVMYVVHPVQRHQHQFLNSLLPPGERVNSGAPEARPWWSYVPSKREGGQGKGDDRE